MESSQNKFSDLVDMVKSWSPRRPAPANVLRDFWMPDDSCRVCYECDSQFTVFNRRHHCRLCGRIFCAKCTSNFVPASFDDLRNMQDESEQKIRVCNYCFKQWDQDMTDASACVSTSTPVLSHSPSTTSLVSTQSTGTAASSITLTGLGQYSPGAYQNTNFGSGSGHSPNYSQCNGHAPDKLDMMISGGNCALSSVGLPVSNDFGFCMNRSDDEDDEYDGCHSQLGGQPFHSSTDYFHAVNFDEVHSIYSSNGVYPPSEVNDVEDKLSPVCDDMSLYGPLEKDKTAEELSRDNNYECNAASALYSIENTDKQPVDIENTERFWLPPDPENEEDEQESSLDDDDDGAGAIGEWGYLKSSSFSSGECRTRGQSSEEHKKAMKNVVDGHFRALVAQLLQAENLPIGEESEKDGWLEIITTLAWEAATLLKPDTSKGGGMDPGGYVKVKCIACGSRTESKVVKGVVCKKNVAHRRMPSKVEKPRLLILGGALEYQRVTNLLSCFDTLLQQEMDHLKMAVAKIDAQRPNVLLVEKSVSRYAQDYLLAKNISLVLNIKKSLLDRISRCTGAQIVPSIDHLSSAKLGHCDLFRVERFFEEHGSADQNGKKLTKTLMFFEGCPKPLGCTILLKGANGDELKKVKRLIHYGVFAAYHLALETSFLADEGASLPELPLKSPITVALPDKPSITNKAISTIPGFSSNEKQVTGDDVQILSPTSIAIHPSVDMNGGRSDKNCQVEQLAEAEKVIHFDSSAPYIVSAFQDVRYQPWNTKEESNVNFVGHSEPKTFRKSIEILNSGCNSEISSQCSPGALESDKIMTNNTQTETRKPLGKRTGNMDLVTSHLNNDEHALSKEEFSPSSDHQSILVSLTTRCVRKGSVCERAHLFRIKYYGTFDKPLGRFLRDHLFDQNYLCRFCDMPSEAHTHCYTHRQGSLTISVRKLSGFLLPGERDGKIWMWHRCLCCPRVEGFPPETKRVVMSDAAWGLSFGKFLELSFSNHAAASRVASCGHSLHRDCLRFYGFGKMVACFRYAPIHLHSVFLPPPILDFSFHHQEWIQKEANEVSEKAEFLFSEVLNALCQLVDKTPHRGSLCGNGTECGRSIFDFEGVLKKEKAEFEEYLHKVVKNGVRKGELVIDILEINKLRKQLLFLAYLWDQRLMFASGSDINNHEVLRGFMPRNNYKIIAPERALSDARCRSMEDFSGTLDEKWTGENNSQLSVDSLRKSSSSAGVFSSFTTSDNSDESMWANEHTADISRIDRAEGNLEDLSNFIEMPFLHFYNLVNKNPSQVLTDYNPAHVSFFRELEHQGGARLLLPVGVDGTVILIYDDEPTSIISYALASTDYHVQICDTCDKPKEGADPFTKLPFSDAGNIHLSRPADEESLRSSWLAEYNNLSKSASKNFLSGDPLAYSKHTRVSFSDDGSLSKVKYTVTCYYAKQFDSLRRTCCPCELDFIRSLSRCKKWGAQGGKSNVFFAKSLDDRFVVKQVTKTELESFIKFAPEYFKYLSESITTGSPTCLAKILGIYQVIIKHVKGGKDLRMDVLVMENLLFGRNITRLYDLKGSSRSRYNADCSGNNKVLLDQNLIEAMPTSPIFVGNKAKRLLERAVWNDTSFLASIDVMDYSLLVGVDEENHELILGIIDFMRQYTWDKHLETWVKASGILGGPKNVSPTVISPEQYKKRFRKAMSGYFTVVPDQWSTPNYQQQQ